MVLLVASISRRKVRSWLARSLVPMPAAPRRSRMTCSCCACCWPAVFKAPAALTAALNSRVMARVGASVCFILVARLATFCCAASSLVRVASRPPCSSRNLLMFFCWAFSSRRRSLVAFNALAVSVEPPMIFFSGPVILSSAANTTCNFKSRPAIYSAPLLCLARSRQAISSSIVKPSIAAGVQWKTPAMSAMASSTSPGIPKGDRLCSPKNRQPRRPQPAGRPGPCWRCRARSRSAR